MKVFSFVLFSILLFANSLNLERQKFLRKIGQHNANLVDISSYHYPKPVDKGGKYNIAIFGTSDIHGAALPIDSKNPLTGEEFTKGGVEYIGKYLQILRDEWGERVIYLDAGDFQQGAYESKISDGKAVIDFFNAQNLAAGGMGNHQFENSEQILERRMSYANYPFVLTNGVNKETYSNYMYEGQIPMLVKKVGKAMIGILGFTTEESMNRAKKYPNFKVISDPDLLIGASDFLKKNLKVDAVILISHAGFECKNQIDLHKLDLYGPESESLCDPEGELVDFLNKAPKYTFDAVVAGHVHIANHFFVNGIPVISPDISGQNVNVIYLTIDLKKHQVIHDEAVIEGPIPVCSKVFGNAKKCSFEDVDLEKEGKMKDFSFHHVKVEKDPRITLVQKPYIDEISKLKNDIICEVDSEIPLGEGRINMFMGDIYADGARAEAGADFAVINLRGFRAAMPAGKINNLQFKNLFPYGGVIWKAEISGEDFIKMMKIIQEGPKQYFSISGCKAVYDIINNKILSVTMADGSPIDPKKIYTLATSDYFFNGGDDFKKVLEFYTPKIIGKYDDINDIMYRRLKEYPLIHKDDYEAADKVRIEVEG